MTMQQVQAYAETWHATRALDGAQKALIHAAVQAQSKPAAELESIQKDVVSLMGRLETVLNQIRETKKENE